MPLDIGGVGLSLKYVLRYNAIYLPYTSLTTALRQNSPAAGRLSSCAAKLRLWQHPRTITPHAISHLRQPVAEEAAPLSLASALHNGRRAREIDGALREGPTFAARAQRAQGRAGVYRVNICRRAWRIFYLLYVRASP